MAQVHKYGGVWSIAQRHEEDLRVNCNSSSEARAPGGSKDMPEMPWSTGWWFQPTPLKNDGLRQLGLWNSQYVYYIYIYGKTNVPNHQPDYEEMEATTEK